MPRLLICLITAGMLAGTATASSTPFGWWTPAKASKVLVSTNPQGIWTQTDHTTILKASCLGVRPYRRSGKTRVYRFFKCRMTFRYDSLGTDPIAWPVPLYFQASGVSRFSVACWATTLAKLKAQRCP